MHSAHGTVRTMATVSSRNASASSAARSGPSSGMSRVFTDPGIGGLAKMQTMASGMRSVSCRDKIMALPQALRQKELFFHAAGGVRAHFFPQRFFCDAAKPPHQDHDRRQTAP